MTNWEARENITFICPDCEHEQSEMTINCPACGKRRLPEASSKSHLYEIVFRMCNGARKEKYLLFLTDEWFKDLKKRHLFDEKIYDLVQYDLWDSVVHMYSDLGCNFGAIMSEIKRIDDLKPYEQLGLIPIQGSTD